MGILGKLQSGIVYQRLSAYLRITRNLASPLLAFVAVDSIIVFFYTEYNWRKGVVRVYDPPQWKGYKREETDNIIESRQPIITAMKNLYEMKEGEASNSKIIDLFEKDCVLEDPTGRFEGRSEILRAFHLLPVAQKEIFYTEFEPIHHEKFIEIKCVRNFQPRSRRGEESMTPRPNTLVIFLSKEEESGKERAKYIAEEWNHVAIVQPETHNVYLLCGTTAKYLRRFCGKMAIMVLDDKKSWQNLFWIRDMLHRLFDDGLSRFQSDREQWLNKSSKTETMMLEQENVFNAGVQKKEENR